MKKELFLTLMKLNDKLDNTIDAIANYVPYNAPEIGGLHELSKAFMDFMEEEYGEEGRNFVESFLYETPYLKYTKETPYMASGDIPLVWDNESLYNYLETIKK